MKTFDTSEVLTLLAEIATSFKEKNHRELSLDLVDSSSMLVSVDGCQQIILTNYLGIKDTTSYVFEQNDKTLKWSFKVSDLEIRFLKDFPTLCRKLGIVA